MKWRAAAIRGSRTGEGGLEYKWVVLINTTVGVVMASLDNSILTISLPSIMHSLNATVVEVMWMVMGYSLVTTALLLPLSRLSDMKGRVKLYNLGFVVFTLSSVACGLSQAGTELLLFRLVQGTGAALLLSNSTALVTDAFPARQRGFALGINMLAGTSAFLGGTLVGGVITQFLGWRYIFFLNLPLGAFAATWAFLKLREIVPPDRQARFDIGGIVTFPLAIGSILAGFTFIVLGKLTDPITSLLFALGVILLGLFFTIERRVAEPMMDLGLFRIRMFWTSNGSLFLNTLSRGANSFMMVWYFQMILNDPPALAGLKLIPLTTTIAIVAPISGRLSDRMGSRRLTTVGLCISLSSLLWMLTFSGSVPYINWGLAFVFLGLGNGLFQAPNTSALMGCVPSRRRGVAAGTRQLLFNTGQTMAIAVAMMILSVGMSYATLTAVFSGTVHGNLRLDGLAFMHGLHEVFLVGAVVTIGAIVLSALRGRDVTAEPEVDLVPEPAVAEPALV
ncbi:MAG TPA: MFS transporter [Chloroflexota bacterium]|nr:MFS transporter [Chloroflexota bacterium]